MEIEIHNTSFLISPITHLFPLTGQLGSCGVSSMITFELKMWNNVKYYQSIQSFMSILNWNKKRKCKKVKQTRIPLGEMVNRLERAYSKRFFFLLEAIKI